MADIHMSKTFKCPERGCAYYTNDAQKLRNHKIKYHKKERTRTFKYEKKPLMEDVKPKYAKYSPDKSYVNKVREVYILFAYSPKGRPG